jgi:1,2-diacylglycerol 3-beta-galactosyltransferase
MVNIIIMRIVVLIMSVTALVNAIVMPHIAPRAQMSLKTMSNWKGNEVDKNHIDALMLDLLGGSISKPDGKKKNVLILMSDTGGGHRASAEALDKALGELFPSRFNVDIVDIWTDHAIWPFNGFVKTYRFLAKYPILWRASYFYAGFPPTRKATEVVSDVTCRQRFRNAMENSQPDIVVSVHPLCQHIPIPIVKEMNKKRSEVENPISFVTVVTDLGGAHETWFNKNVDFCFVPSKAVKNIALKVGITRDKIIKHGLPVRPTFWGPPEDKLKLRNKLDLNKNDKTVLLMGGGDGVGGLKQIANEISKRLSNLQSPTQMVVICGHNKQLATDLTRQVWPKNVNVEVKGFCNNVDEYMGASDCLVTKAGPGTIAEAMTRGLPIILSSFLPGQEKGNVPYVVDGGFGVYSGNKPNKIAKHVYKLFTDEKSLRTMSQRSFELSSAGATRNIALDIGHICLRKERSMPKLKDKYLKGE